MFSGRRKMVKESTSENVSNTSLTPFTRIKLCIAEYPYKQAKVALEALGLSYKKYGGTYRTEKCKFRNALQFGRVHRALDHRLVLVGKLDFEQVDKIRKLAEHCRPAKGNHPAGKWYMAPNRNSMMCFKDKNRGSLKIHLNGHLIVEARSRNFNEVEDAAFEALYCGCSGPFGFEETNAIIRMLNAKSRHRAIYIGKDLSSFRTDFYKKSLGLSIAADQSHPKYLEIAEDWPTWAFIQQKLIEDHVRIDVDQRGQDRQIVHELAEQIASHLKVMEGIGEAVGRLNGTLSSQAMQESVSGMKALDDSSKVENGSQKKDRDSFDFAVHVGEKRAERSCESVS